MSGAGDQDIEFLIFEIPFFADEAGGDLARAIAGRLEKYRYLKHIRVIQLQPETYNRQMTIDRPHAAIFLLNHSAVLQDRWSALAGEMLRQSIPVIGLLVGDVAPERVQGPLREHLVMFNQLDDPDRQIALLHEQLELAITTQYRPAAVNLKVRENTATGVRYIITSVLADLLLRAQKLHEVYKSTRTNEPDIAFTSLLFAFVAVSDPIAQWFSAFIARTGVDVEAALRPINRDVQSLQEVKSRRVAVLDVDIEATMSVRNIFSEAWALVSKSPLDIRHIMATLIYKPGSHASELSAWKFNREQWSLSFLGFIAEYYPDALPVYSRQHETVFSTTPEPVVVDVPKRPPPHGPSTHIDSDRWTTDDTLGYDAYAHAIYRFLTHGKTKPPLTISIQAPWGGGKTSLMRMIQQRLDPDAIPKDDTLIESEPSESKDHTSIKSESSDERLSIRRVLDEIKKWTAGERPQTPQVEKDARRKRLTVWFNAWKYESVNQVWAGLADTIVRQVTDRMTPVERELFWFQLHFRRVDVEKIRQKIYDRIVMHVWRFAVKVIPVVAALLLAGAVIIAAAGIPQWIGWSLTGASVPLGLIAVAIKYMLAKRKVEAEPADISLSEYVSAPNYSAELGFIHQAERDLQRVFECIPHEYKPLVVFIDDLDRCSPGKVAQVMEAINLFLAGEFPNCIFVLGMDSELVAAALQAAHKDMIEALDNHTKTPVGWRFMDKFIQLPFIIPPCEPDGIDRYTTALFASRNGAVETEGPGTVMPHVANDTTTMTKYRGATPVPQPDTGAAQPTSEELRAMIRAKIDEGVEQFRDDNPAIEKYIAQGRSYFRGNPREMKRFANTFRFHYFLRWAREAQPGAESPTPEQVVRWTVLAMKWPEVARWLHSGFGVETAVVQGTGGDRSGVQTRLLRIEQCSAADTAEKWKEALTAEFTPGREKPYHWLDDGDLFRFFKREMEMKESERLSAGAGKGLW